MQNRDVGDAPDFGKYALLNALCYPKLSTGESNLTLGVVWYLKPDDSKRRTVEIGPDNRSRLASCDPVLWDKLQRVQKHVRGIEQCGILCSETKYYWDLVPDNLSVRASTWQPAALNATEECDVVFLDPDIGLEMPGKGNRSPAEYVLLSEISPYLQRNQSVIIYQHLHWSQKDNATLREKWESMQRRLPGYGGFAMRYDVGPVHVSFIVIPSDRYWDVLATRARNLLEQVCWKQCFKWIDLA